MTELRRARLRWPVALALTAGAAAAVADPESGYYAGAGAGRYHLALHEFADDGLDFDDRGAGFRLFGGVRFNPWIAVELAYLDLGAPGEDLAGVYIESASTGVAPYVVGTLPLGRLELYARAGILFRDVKLTARAPESGEQTADTYEENFVYGAGAGVVIRHVNLRLEYERVDVPGADTSDSLWLSAAYRF